MNYDTMLHHQTFPSTSLHITSIHAMLMDTGEYAEYIFERFPYEFNELTNSRLLYPSLVMEIIHERMPLTTSSSRCRVRNALIAYWNLRGKTHSQEVIVVEFQSIQHALKIEPDITQCKKILLNMIRTHWNVTFKNGQLVIN